MKLRKIKISLSVLTGLVILSFAFFVAAKSDDSSSKNILLDSDRDGLTDQEEKTYGTDARNPDSDGDGYTDGGEVKSGYDPLKPAPGDKLVKGGTSADSTASTDGDTANLTNEIAAKIKEMTLDQPSDGQGATIDSINEMISSSLSQVSSDITLPEITRDQIKIKKQNFSGLSAEKIKEKKKEDFSSYIAATYYVISSNSPEPITSGSDITSAFSSLSQQVMKAITSRNPSILSDVNKSGERIMEQLQDVEVPEDLADTHIKALKFAQYAKSVEQYLNPNSSDPLADIANLSKIQGLIVSLMSFSEEAQAKFSEYGLTYDDVSGKIKSYGANLPEDQTIIPKTSDSSEEATDTDPIE